MDVTGCLSLMSELTFNPLKIDSNVTALKTFEDVLQTSVGPKGKLKIIRNIAGGHVTVTSSSTRLLNIVSVQNIFVKMIVASIKSHLSIFGNDGLCCALLTLKLINNSFSLSYPSPLIGKLYECIGKIFIDNLNHCRNLCVKKIDFTTISSLQSLVETILHSKPGCILKLEDKMHLSLLLIKGFLNCIPIPASPVCFKNLSIITLEGTNSSASCLYEGLLIRSSATSLKCLTCLQKKTSIKIILYTTSLSGDAEFPVDDIEVTSDISIWEVVLSFLRSVIRKVIDSKIDVLACQKVVHPSLRKQLEDANVLVLDRLGFETSKYLEYISGSSNSSLFDEPTFGYLTSISKKTIGKKEFLLLFSSSRPFCTIQICNFNEQAVNETKVVCQQVIDTLFRLLKSPSVCFGAGCSEIYTSNLVKQKVLECINDIKQEFGCSTSQILEVLHIFLQSIGDLVSAIHQDCSLNLLTESTFGHLWKLNEGKFPSAKETCMCGQFYADGIKDSSWSFLNNLDQNELNTNEFQLVKMSEEMNKNIILDELSSKSNAYSTAFETASLLLRVSVCVKS